MNAFNCKVGKFPMKYLKLPISFKRLIKEELSGSIGKVEKRLKTWKCNQLSHGGKAFSSIQISQEFLCTQWVSIGYKKGQKRDLILLEEDSFGKE